MKNVTKTIGALVLVAVLAAAVSTPVLAKTEQAPKMDRLRVEMAKRGIEFPHIKASEFGNPDAMRELRADMERVRELAMELGLYEEGPNSRTVRGSMPADAGLDSGAGISTVLEEMEEVGYSKKALDELLEFWWTHFTPGEEWVWIHPSVTFDSLFFPSKLGRADWEHLGPTGTALWDTMPAWYVGAYDGATSGDSLGAALYLRNVGVFTAWTYLYDDGRFFYDIAGDSLFYSGQSLTPGGFPETHFFWSHYNEYATLGGAQNGDDMEVWANLDGDSLFTVYSSVADVDPPATVPAIGVTEPSNTTKTLWLSWDPSPDDDGGDNDVVQYHVWRREPADKWRLHEVIPAFNAKQPDTAYSFFDTDVVVGTEYKYAVYAFDGANRSAPSDSVADTPLNILAPPTGADLCDAVEDEGGRLKLLWTPSVDDSLLYVGGVVDHYYVYFDTIGVGEDTLAKYFDMVGPGKGVYIAAGLPDSLFQFWVQAVSYVGGSPHDSSALVSTGVPASPVDNAVTFPVENPVAFDTPNDAGGSITVMWDLPAGSNADAESLYVYRADTSNVEYLPCSGSNVPRYIIARLEYPDTMYVDNSVPMNDHPYWYSIRVVSTDENTTDNKGPLQTEEGAWSQETEWAMATLDAVPPDISGHAQMIVAGEKIDGYGALNCLNIGDSMAVVVDDINVDFHGFDGTVYLDPTDTKNFNGPLGADTLILGTYDAFTDVMTWVSPWYVPLELANTDTVIEHPSQVDSLDGSNYRFAVVAALDIAPSVTDTLWTDIPYCVDNNRPYIQNIYNVTQTEAIVVFDDDDIYLPTLEHEDFDFRWDPGTGVVHRPTVDGVWSKAPGMFTVTFGDTLPRTDTPVDVTFANQDTFYIEDDGGNRTPRYVAAVGDSMPPCVEYVRTGWDDADNDGVIDDGESFLIVFFSECVIDSTMDPTNNWGIDGADTLDPLSSLNWYDQANGPGCTGLDGDSLRIVLGGSDRLQHTYDTPTLTCNYPDSIYDANGNTLWECDPAGMWEAEDGISPMVVFGDGLSCTQDLDEIKIDFLEEMHDTVATEELWIICDFDTSYIINDGSMDTRLGDFDDDLGDGLPAGWDYLDPATTVTKSLNDQVTIMLAGRDSLIDGGHQPWLRIHTDVEDQYGLHIPPDPTFGDSTWGEAFRVGDCIEPCVVRAVTHTVQMVDDTLRPLHISIEFTERMEPDNADDNWFHHNLSHFGAKRGTKLFRLAGEDSLYPGESDGIDNDFDGLIDGADTLGLDETRFLTMEFLEDPTLFDTYIPEVCVARTTDDETGDPWSPISELTDWEQWGGYLPEMGAPGHYYENILCILDPDDYYWCGQAVDGTPLFVTQIQTENEVLKAMPYSMDDATIEIVFNRMMDQTSVEDKSNYLLAEDSAIDTLHADSWVELDLTGYMAIIHLGGDDVLGDTVENTGDTPDTLVLLPGLVDTAGIPFNSGMPDTFWADNHDGVLDTTEVHDGVSPYAHYAKLRWSEETSVPGTGGSANGILEYGEFQIWFQMSEDMGISNYDSMGHYRIDGRMLDSLTTIYNVDTESLGVYPAGSSIVLSLGGVDDDTLHADSRPFMEIILQTPKVPGDNLLDQWVDGVALGMQIGEPVIPFGEQVQDGIAPLFMPDVVITVDDIERQFDICNDNDATLSDIFQAFVRNIDYNDFYDLSPMSDSMETQVVAEDQDVHILIHAQPLSGMDADELSLTILDPINLVPVTLTGVKSEILTFPSAASDGYDNDWDTLWDDTPGFEDVFPTNLLGNENFIFICQVPYDSLAKALNLPYKYDYGWEGTDPMDGVDGYSPLFTAIADDGWSMTSREREIGFDHDNKPPSVSVMDTPVDTTSGGAPLGGSVADIDGTIYLSGIVGLQADAISDNDGALFRFLISSHEDDAPKAPGEWLDIDLDPGSAATCGPFAQGVDAVGDGDGAPGFAGVDDDLDGGTDLSDPEIMLADFDCDGTAIGAGGLDFEDEAYAAFDDDEDGLIDMDFPFNEDPWYVDDFMNDHDQEFFVLGYNSTVADSHPHDITESNQFLFDTDYFEETLFGYCSPHCAEDIRNLIDAGMPVFLKSAVYDWAGNVRIDYAAPIPVIIDNYIAGAMLSLWQLDGITEGDEDGVRVGIQAYGEKTYLVKADPSEPEDVAGITFQLYQDFGAGWVYIGDIGPEDTSPPYAIEWKVPPVGNVPPYNEDEYRITAAVRDKANNMSAADHMYVTAIDITPPVCTLYEVNGVYVGGEVGDHWTFHHIPQASAVPVKAYFEPTDPNNDDIIKVVFEYKYTSEPGKAWTEFASVTGHCECDDGIDNDGDGLIDFPDDPDEVDIYDLTEPEHSGVVVVTWDTRNVPVGDYDVRAVGIDVEGNKDELGAPIRSVTIDVASLRAYVQSPERHSGVIPLWAYSYEMYVKVGPIDRVTFEFYEDTNGNMLPDDGNNWTLIGTTQDTLGTADDQINVNPAISRRWNINWDTAGIGTSGIVDYLVRAVAKDAFNNIDEAAPYIPIMVQNIAPIASFVYPAPDGSTVIYPGFNGVGQDSWEDIINELIEFEVTTNAVDIESMKYYYRIPPDTMWHLVLVDTTQEVAKSPATWTADEYWDTGILMGDQDLDGWVDGYEVWAGTDPTDPMDFPTDEDGDWRSNYEEWFWGTDSLDADDYPADTVLYGRDSYPPGDKRAVKRNSIEYSSVIWMNNGYYRDDTNVLLKAVAVDTGGVADPFPAETHVIVLERMRPYASILTGPAEGSTVCADSITDITGIAADNRLIDRVELRYCIKDTGGVWDSTATDSRKHWKVAWVDTAYPYGTWSYWNGVYWEERPYVFDVFNIPGNDPVSGWDVFDLRFGLYAYDVAGNRSFQVDSLDHHIRHITVDHRPQPYRFPENFRLSEDNRFTDTDTVAVVVQRLGLGCRRDPTGLRLQIRVNDDVNDMTPNWYGWGDRGGAGGSFNWSVVSPTIITDPAAQETFYVPIWDYDLAEVEMRLQYRVHDNWVTVNTVDPDSVSMLVDHDAPNPQTLAYTDIDDWFLLADTIRLWDGNASEWDTLMPGTYLVSGAGHDVSGSVPADSIWFLARGQGSFPFRMLRKYTYPPANPLYGPQWFGWNVSDTSQQYYYDDDLYFNPGPKIRGKINSHLLYRQGDMWPPSGSWTVSDGMRNTESPVFDWVTDDPGFINGYYQLRIRSFDDNYDDGICTPASSAPPCSANVARSGITNFTMYVDATDPEAYIDPALDNMLFADQITVQAFLTDDSQYADVDSVIFFYRPYKASGSPNPWTYFASQHVGNLEVVFDADSLGLGFGSYDLVAMAIDLAGNWENSGIGGMMDIDPELAGNENTGYVTVTRTEGPRFSQIYGLYFTPYDSTGPSDLGNSLNRSDELDTTGLVKVSGDELDFLVETMGYPAEVESVWVTISRGSTKETFSYEFPLVKLTGNGVPITFTLYESDFPEVYDWTAVGLAGDFNGVDPSGTYWNVTEFEMYPDTLNHTWSRTIWLPTLPAWQEQTFGYQFVINHERDRDRWVNDPRNTNNFITYGPTKSEMNGGMPVTAVTVPAIPTDPNSDLWWTNIDLTQFTSGALEWTITAVDEDGWAMTWPTERDCDGWLPSYHPSGHKWGCVLDRLPPQAEVTVVDQDLTVKAGGEVDLSAIAPDLPVVGEVYTVTELRFQVLPQNGIDWRDVGTDTDASDGWRVTWSIPKLDEDNVDTDGDGFVDEDDEAHLDATFQVRALPRDDGYNYGTSTVASVTVDDSDPIAIITHPEQSTVVSFGDVVDITAEIHPDSPDEDAEIDSMQFWYINNSNWTKIGTDRRPYDGWEMMWRTDLLPEEDGYYILYAMPFDEVGNAGTTPVPHLVVINDTLAPAAFITHIVRESGQAVPVVRDEIAISGVVNIKGAAPDPTTVAVKVMFRALGDTAWTLMDAGVVPDTTFTGSGVPWDTRLLNLVDTTAVYEIAAWAVDSDGNEDENPVIVQVLVDYEVPWHDEFDLFANTDPDPAVFYNGYYPDTSGIVMVGDPTNNLVTFYLTSPHEDIASMWAEFRPQGGSMWWTMGPAGMFEYRDNLECGDVIEGCTLERDGVWVLENDIDVYRYFFCMEKGKDINWDIWEFRAVQMDSAGNTSHERHPFGRAFEAFDCFGPDIMSFWTGWDPFDPKDVYEVGDTARMAMAATDALTDVVKAVFYWDPTFGDTLWVPVDPDPSTPEVEEAPITVENLDTEMPVWRSEVLFNTALVGYISMDKTVPLKVKVWDTAGNTSVDYFSITVQDNTPPTNTYIAWMKQTSGSAADSTLENIAVGGSDVWIGADNPTDRLGLRWITAEAAPYGTPKDGDWIFVGRDTLLATGFPAAAILWNTLETDAEMNPIFPDGDWWLRVYSQDAAYNVEVPDPDNYILVTVDNTGPVVEIVMPDDGDIFQRYEPGVDPILIEADVVDGSPRDEEMTEVKWYHKQNLEVNIPGNWVTTGFDPVMDDTDPFFTEWTTGANTKANWSYDIIAVGQDELGNGDLSTAAAMAAWEDGLGVTITLVDTIAPWVEVWQVAWMPVIDGHVTVGISDTIRVTARSQIGDLHVESVLFQYHNGEEWVDIALDMAARGDGAGHAVIWDAMWDVVGLGGTYPVRAVGRDDNDNADTLYSPVVDVTIDAMPPVGEITAYYEFGGDGSETVEITDGTLERGFSNVMFHAHDFVPDEELQNVGFWYKHDQDIATADSSWMLMGTDMNAPHSIVIPKNNTYTMFQYGHTYDFVAIPKDMYDNAPEFGDVYAMGAPYVLTLTVTDETCPQAWITMIDSMAVPDEHVFASGMIDMIMAKTYAPDVQRVLLKYREVSTPKGKSMKAAANGDWILIGEMVPYECPEKAPKVDPGQTWIYSGWNTEMLNGFYELAAFGVDNVGNECSEPASVPLTIDNENPATCDLRFVDYETLEDVTVLERGQKVILTAEAADDGLYEQSIVVMVDFQYKLHDVDDPTAWQSIDNMGDPHDWQSESPNPDYNEPYAVTLEIPYDLVAHQNYDFRAIATDFVGNTNVEDVAGAECGGQRWYLVEDTEAEACITDLGDSADWTPYVPVPHINGNVDLRAEADPDVIMVEFMYSTDQVYWTMIDIDSIASRDKDMNTVFVIYDWNVDVLPEGTYYITSVPTDDMGNTGENDPTCIREVVIDHGFTGDVVDYDPMDDDEIGGWYPDCVDTLIHPTDLWVAFDSNADIDTVIFEWKLSAQPDVEQSWSRAWFGCDEDTPGVFFDPTGVAQYEGGTNTWTFPLMDCNISDGMYDFRAKVKDISVPDENVEVFNLATGVIVDNTPTNQMYSYISEVNGDVTPQGTHIPNSATDVSITATAFDRPAGEVMTGISEVRFLVDGLVIDIDTVADANGVYRVYWNVTGLEPGSHYLSLEVIDEVGNAWCGSQLDVWIDDVLPPTAHIVAYDTDNECWDTDRFWAMVECRDTEEMDQVRFEYREATGKMKADKDPDWINLGADDTGEHIPGGCYVYEITMDTGQLEDGMYELRAIAEDANQNTDPNPPVFMFQKYADGSIAPVDGGLVSDVEVWDDLVGSEWTDVTDVARVQSTGGRPYVFALAEGIRDDGVDDCFTDQLYCMEVSDVMGADNYWTGINPAIMGRPCGPVFAGYGTVTFFGSVVDGDNYVDMGDGMLTVYEMFAERGTNGMVTSDDGMVDVRVSGTASLSDGQVYIEPRFTMPELPDYQYFYTPVGYAYDIQLQTAELVDPDADPVHAFARVTLHYNEGDVEGLDEDLLAAVWWNPYAGRNGAWVHGLNTGLYDTEVDTDANTVSFKITNDALQTVLWTIGDSLGTKQDEECQWSSCLVTIMANTEGFMISEPRFWPQSDAIMDVPVTCPTTLVSVFIRDGDGTIPYFDKMKTEDRVEKDNGGCISTYDCIGWSDRINVWVDDIRVIRNGVGTNGYFVCLRDSISGEWIIGVDYDVNPGYDGLEEGYHTIRIMARNGDNDWVDTGDFQFYVDVTPPEIETFGGWFGYHDNIIRAKIWDNESEIYLRDIEITLGAGSTESWCEDGQEFEIGYDDIVIERVSERGDTVWIMYEPIVDVMDAIFAEALGDSCEEGNEIWVEWCYVRNVLDDAVNGRGIGNKDSISEHGECCDFTTDCVTTIYIIDSFMPYVTAVVPHGDPIDNDGDGRFNEDPPDDYCYGDAYFFDWWWFDWEDWWIDWTDMCDDCCENDGYVDDDYYCECDCDIEFDWEHWNWFFMYFHPYDNDGDMRYGEDPIDFTPAVLPGDWMPSIIAYFEDPDRDPCGHSGGSVSGIDPDGVELFLIHGDGTMRNLTEEADITETRIAWSDDEPLDAGRYHVVVFVADNVGNTNYLEWDFIVVRDETAPMITAVAPAGMAIDNDGDGIYNEDPVDFALDCEDACCDDCTWVPYDNDMDGLANEDPIDFGPAHLPVNWMPSIVAYFEDPLPGCVDECEQGYPNWACGIDTESVIMLLQHADGTLDTLDADVTESYVSWSSNTELEGGMYHAMVFVSDCAGNSAFYEWSFEVEGDEAPPLVGDIRLAEDIYVGTAQPTICVSFSDEGSGVATAMIEITGPDGVKTTGYATSEDIATGEYCFTPEEPFTLPGLYTIKAVVTDNNGQMTTAMSEFLLEAAELEIANAHNYPNPFTGSTTIAFEITRWHNVRVTATIYDFADRKVNTLRAVPIAGTPLVEIPWNGTSSDGTHVASGVYFIVVNVTDGSDTVSEVIKAAVIGE